jgi:hypothetical protein
MELASSRTAVPSNREAPERCGTASLATGAE